MNQRQWGWLLLVWCASVFLSGRYASGQAWFLLSIAVWGMALAYSASLRWREGLSSWIAWAFWGGMCVVWSREPGMAVFTWWREASFILVLVLAYSWWHNAHRRVWLAGLWTMGLLSGVLFPRSEYSAALLSAAAASCAALWLGPVPGETRWRRLIGAAALLSAIGLALSNSRFGLFSCAFSALLCLSLTAGRARRIAAAAGLACAAVAAVLISVHSAKSSPVAASAIPIIESSPIIGVGPGLLGRTAPGLEKAAIPSPMRSVLETGWIGFGLFFFAVVAVFPRNFRRMDWEARAAFGAFVAILIHSLGVDVLSIPAVQTVFFTALSCSFGSPSSAPLPEERPEWPISRLACALGFLMCLAAWAPIELVRRGYRHAASSHPDVRIDGLRSVIEAAPFDAQARIRLAREALFGKPKRIGAALYYLESALRIEPNNALFWAQRAELFAGVADWTRALGSARRSIELDPLFPNGRLIAALAHLRRGEVEQAKRGLAVALEIHEGRRGLPGYNEPLMWDQARYQALAQELARAR